MLTLPKASMLCLFYQMSFEFLLLQQSTVGAANILKQFQ